MNKKWFAVLRVFVLVSTLVLSTFSYTFAGPNFPDIQKHWAKTWIERAVKEGIVTGYPNGTFQPDRPLSRAEFSTILVKASKLAGVDAVLPFKDVPKAYWGYEFIQKAYAKGWIAGFPDGTFQPDKPVNREQAAVILTKKMEAETRGVAYQIPYANVLDKNNISEWAFTQVAWLMQESIIKGTTNKTFLPQKPLTRAEAVVMLLNVLDYKAPQPKNMVLSTTTSTYDSGLLDVIIPIYEASNHVRVKVISVGTGQAITTARSGDADCILVHDRAAEDLFMKDGFGSYRLDVMYNDFILIGPASDPKDIKETNSILEAFKKIAQTEATFISRGDKSGTHSKELGIWKSAGIEPTGKSWYVSAGQGMGAVLLMANEKQAYTLTDRATYLKYIKDKKINLVIINEGSAQLLNPYGIMPVSPQKYPHVQYDFANKLCLFMTGIPGQKMIGEYGVKDFGSPLFFPDSLEYKAYLKNKK